MGGSLPALTLRGGGCVQGPSPAGAPLASRPCATACTLNPRSSGRQAPPGALSPHPVPRAPLGGPRTPGSRRQGETLLTEFLNRPLNITARLARRRPGRVSPQVPARPRQPRDAASRQPGSPGKGRLGHGQRGGAGTEASLGPPRRGREGPEAANRCPHPAVLRLAPPAAAVPRRGHQRALLLLQPAARHHPSHSCSRRRLTAGIRVAMGIGK